MFCKLSIHTNSGLYVHNETVVGSKLIDAINTDHSLNAPCGGRGTCGKCRVKATGKLSPVSETECGLLSPVDIENGIRLACMTTIEGDAEVWLSEEKARILTEGSDLHVDLLPAVSVEQLNVPEPDLDDQRSDLERLYESLGAETADVSLHALRKLPEILRATEHHPWILRDLSGKIIDITANEPCVYGAAIDIGTTTIAAYLIDLKSGTCVQSRSAMNPQRAYGADVISRIDYARAENGLDTLQKTVVSKISELIRSMLIAVGASDTDLKHIICVGNTVMVHLLLGISPENIASSPFIPAFTQKQRYAAAEIGLPFSCAVVETGACVAGYIGADTTAAAIACDMDEREGVYLLIDIGTNGEIALGGRDGIVCCSAAAGPAFEGAHIRCGSGAVEGAVSSVRLTENGGVLLETIGGAVPSSICGSGLVDAIAEMIRVGIVDETGRIDEDEVPEIWEDRIFDSPAGLSFALTEDKTVYICQKDIREVQLAKGAIAAGVQILLKQSGVGFDKVQKLFLAGGFGNYIDIHNACMIGLLPSELEHCAEPVGNAAGTGAQIMLMNHTLSSRCSSMAHYMKYIELSSQREFTELFSENMLFEI